MNLTSFEIVSSKSFTNGIVCFRNGLFCCRNWYRTIQSLGKCVLEAITKLRQRRWTGTIGGGMSKSRQIFPGCVLALIMDLVNRPTSGKEMSLPLKTPFDKKTG
ncbi:hypothetical protein TNIN_6741 [Trichonephila inaurata madagascariensis]|uniref:Uncharacterized protein n=1 Tax=Trichonephila inaurata madagascariensis TaxID=2747483 RepID=A0A8X6WP09_9ARAC|nr:hypothetical protein TNIN_6741 [Trichonephila inaurata madagascariensis]